MTEPPSSDASPSEGTDAHLSSSTSPTRRDAITWLAVGGLTVGGLAAFAAACSASTSTSSSTTTAPGSSSPGSSGGGSGSSASTVTGAQGATCVLTPEMTEGPYYIDDEIDRRDITEGKDGAPFALALTVVDATTCEPIADAVVDIWHCDAGGTYSGFVSQSIAGNGGSGDADGASPGGAPPGGGSGGAPPGGGPGGGGVPGGGGTGATDDTRFLRGIQTTDASGVARFDTIYPGWYQGRAVHIHVKVHVASEGTGAGNDTVVHTGQLFFDEQQTDAVYAEAPYSSHTGTRLRNDADSIYRGGGNLSIVSVTPQGKGFDGALMMGVQRSAAAPVQ